MSISLRPIPLGVGLATSVRLGPGRGLLIVGIVLETLARFTVIC